MFESDPHQLNQARLKEAYDYFIEGSLAADDVSIIYPHLSAGKLAVLTEETELLGKAVGGQVLYPAWQFDETGVRPDLPEILHKIKHFSTDALLVDRVMRLVKHSELGDKTIIDCIDSGDEEEKEQAYHLLSSSGGY